MKVKRNNEQAHGNSRFEIAISTSHSFSLENKIRSLLSALYFFIYILKNLVVNIVRRLLLNQKNNFSQQNNNRIFVFPIK